MTSTNFWKYWTYLKKHKLLGQALKEAAEELYSSKQAKKQGKDIEKLFDITEKITKDETLDEKYKDNSLAGKKLIMKNG